MVKAAPKKSKGGDGLSVDAGKEALREYIEDISQRASTPDESLIHCVIAVNQILSDQESVALLDEPLKSRLREIWANFQSAGIQLTPPPILFGLPENLFVQDEAN
ncbi:MAG TPA: hypothetical protein PKA63_07215 [Oligoflexia bacterium]|nr:hypothetical protein [Oligoflexia bacterium]HMP48438.1 hypothetical protein [Oligoflexia bacterium]